MEQVILVDKDNQPLGSMEKMEAHEKGLLHRAFSIFIFNKKHELLLQKRASSKYHSGGLWTNSCCSHPRPEESILEAGSRRLHEELGFTTPIEEVFAFTYRAELDKGLTEHEFDHVLFGIYEGPIELNEEEAEDYKYISKKELSEQILESPEKYTEWFKIALPRVMDLWPK